MASPPKQEEETQKVKYEERPIPSEVRIHTPLFTNMSNDVKNLEELAIDASGDFPPFLRSKEGYSSVLAFVSDT